MSVRENRTTGVDGATPGRRRSWPGRLPRAYGQVGRVGHGPLGSALGRSVPVAREEAVS